MSGKYGNNQGRFDNSTNLNGNQAMNHRTGTASLTNIIPAEGFVDVCLVAPSGRTGETRAPGRRGRRWWWWRRGRRRREPDVVEVAEGTL